MTTTEQAILWVYAALIAIWPIRYAVVAWVLRSIDILTERSPRFDQPDPPVVTAVIPARDEEAVLANCLASVCSQTYPSLEILVVDDRSTDRTPEIARGFAQADSRVRVITIEDLPRGWTGKTHALQTAADVARGDWFWFLDADTRHEPDNLSIVMEYARRNNAALASLLPEMRCETFWESVVQPLAGIDLIQEFPLNFVNDDRNKLAFANGQYILIRRDAYFQAGGHHAVRDRFVEDIAMAYKVKGLGLPIRVAVAHGIGSTRMYASLTQLVRGWSRILYDALDRSPWRLLWKFLDPLIFSQSGHAALVVSLVMLAAGVRSTFAWALLGMSVVHHAFAYLVLRKLYLLTVPGSRHVAWYPLANLVMDWVLVRSIGMCLTGRVTWRGTAYGPGEEEHPQMIRMNAD
jgi:glycosyltransferase involved in cell wall biosynthesis